MATGTFGSVITDSITARSGDLTLSADNIAMATGAPSRPEHAVTLGHVDAAAVRVLTSPVFACGSAATIAIPDSAIFLPERAFCWVCETAADVVVSVGTVETGADIAVFEFDGSTPARRWVSVAVTTPDAFSGNVYVTSTGAGSCRVGLAGYLVR